MAGHAKADLGKGKLKGKAARGGAAAVLSELFRMGIRIGTTAILARLLVPEDFGVVAIVMGYILILEGIANAGVSAAALRERDLTPQQSSNLFWCNAGLSLLAAGFAIATGPFLGEFVGNDRVDDLIPLASLGLVFAGLGAQQRVILDRTLQFGSMARAEAMSVTVGMAFSVLLASLGAGAISIIAGTVLSYAALTISRWRVAGWRPGRFRRGHGTRRLVRRGFGLMLVNFLQSMRASSEAVILGRFAGAAEVGYYTKAFGLLSMPVGRMLVPMTRVALPILVQLWPEPERFRKAYFRLVAFLGLTTTPLIAFLFFGAEDVVRIVLGEQFGPSVPLFRIFAIASIGMATGASTTWVQHASGRVKRQIGLAAWMAGLVVTGNLVGAWLGGATGMAIGYVIAVQVGRQPACWIALRGSPIPYRGFVAATVPGTVVALVGSAAMAVPEFLMDLPRPIDQVTALAWPRVRTDVHEVVDMVRAAGFLKRRNGTAATTAPVPVERIDPDLPA